MFDRALDRLCAWVFGSVEPIDHDAIDALIESTAARERSMQVSHEARMPSMRPGSALPRPSLSQPDRNPQPLS